MRCERCGNEYQASPGSPCPYCGAAAPAPPTGGPGGGAGSGWGPPPAGYGMAPPPPPPEPPRDGPPWERQRSIQTLFETLKEVLLKPTETFRGASRTAGIGYALLYALIFGLIGRYFALGWQVLQQVVKPRGYEVLTDMYPALEEYMEVVQSPAFWVAMACLTPFLLVIGLFLWSAIVHLLLMLFGGAASGFEATFRTIAYCSGSTAVFQIVPFCGWLADLVWSLVVQIIGLREIHGTSTGRTAAAVLLPIGLCCCCMGIVWLLALFGLIAATQR